MAGLDPASVDSLPPDETEEQRQARLNAMFAPPAPAPVNPLLDAPISRAPAPAGGDAAPAGLPPLGAPAPAPLPAATVPAVAGPPNNPPAPGAAPAPGMPVIPPAAPGGLQVVGGSTTTFGPDVKTTALTAEGKKVMGEREAIKAREQGALGEEAKINERNAKQNLAQTAGYNQKVASAEEISNARRQILQDAKDKADALVTQKTKEYGDAKIESFFQRKGPAATVISVLGAAVGEIFNFSHTGNPGWEIFRHAIDKDFEQQKLEIAHRKDIVELARQDATAAAEKIKAEDYNLQIKKLGLLEAAKRYAAEEAARNGVTDAQFNASKAKIMLDKMYNDEDLRLRKDIYKEIDQRGQQATIQKGVINPGAAPENMVYGPGGQPIGAAPTKEVAKETNTAVSSYTNMRKALNEYQKLVDKSGLGVLDNKDRGRLNALRSTLLFETNHLVNPNGVMRQSEQDYFENMVPDATGLTGTFTSRASMHAKLNTLANVLRERTGSTLEAAGINKRVLSDVDRMTSGRPGE